ncbi:NBP35 Cytosolic Fe-S cluster assembly factor NBP35 [Candida maltosa Xu316]|uniref:Uncharacterized protein n=1 Tax=Candida maltosa (strain Xu316) TaxID=1245528 RepID=M3K0I0_CANMX|nr:hypothetical protein G210_1310 [Candida maltosa Xu316]
MTPHIERKQPNELKEPEPEHCPGPESENAGKGDACNGCANQEICTSNILKGPDPDIPIINERLANISHKILVLSGKGGVGKSTFTSMLSWAISTSDEDLEIGAMDLDICGPSLPKMLGVEGESIHNSNSGWTPVYVSDNLGLMSISFMLPDSDTAIIWRGNKKNGLIKNFLKDVNWGDHLDYLIVDTPPGTSDEHLSVVNYMKDVGIDGALIVTTPQEVSLLDVRKEIDFCRKTGIKILGLVENMSGFVCPGCKKESLIFKPTTGGGKKLCEELNIPFLGSVPLDPRIGKCCDAGQNFFEDYSDSPAATAILDVVDAIRDQVELDEAMDKLNI